MSGGGHLGRSMEQGLSDAMRDALQAGSRGGMLASRLRTVSFDEDTYNAMQKGTAAGAGLDFGVSASHRYSMGAGGGAAAAASMGLTDHPRGSPALEGGVSREDGGSDSDEDSDADDTALASRFLGFTSALGRSAHVPAPGSAPPARASAGVHSSTAAAALREEESEEAVTPGLPLPAALGGGQGEIPVKGAHIPMGQGGGAEGAAPPTWDVFVQLLHSAADQAAAQSPARSLQSGAQGGSADGSTQQHSGSSSDSSSDSSGSSDSSTDSDSDSSGDSDSS